MYRIKTLNKISSAGLDLLDQTRFQVGGEVENEDGILVRSAPMHDYVFPEELRAIARAGAGTNNIPIDRCSENGIVVFNTVISVSQEDNARKALEALRKLSSPKAKVLRDCGVAKLDSTDLVPGDIVWLDAGDYVPADGRILWEAGLQPAESAMAGESGAVAERAGRGLTPATP